MDNLYIYCNKNIKLKIDRRRVDNYKFTAIIKYINTASELLAKLHYRYELKRISSYFTYNFGEYFVSQIVFGYFSA